MMSINKQILELLDSHGVDNKSSIVRYGIANLNTNKILFKGFKYDPKFTSEGILGDRNAMAASLFSDYRINLNLSKRLRILESFEQHRYMFKFAQQEIQSIMNMYDSVLGHLFATILRWHTQTRYAVPVGFYDFLAIENIFDRKYDDKYLVKYTNYKDKDDILIEHAFQSRYECIVIDKPNLLLAKLIMGGAHYPIQEIPIAVFREVWNALTPKIDIADEIINSVHKMGTWDVYQEHNYGELDESRI